MKHIFQINEFGKRDDFQLDAGFHNGPRCILCDTSFCKHCNPERLDENCSVSKKEIKNQLNYHQNIVKLLQKSLTPRKKKTKVKE